MSYVYITEQGAIVKKSGNRLRVILGSETLRWISVTSVKQLVIMGNVQLTSQAVHLCLRFSVDTIFLNYAGKYIGRLLGPIPAYSKLRWAQYKFFHDEINTLEFVKKVIKGKIINQRRLLLKRTKPTTATTELRRLAQKTEKAGSIDIARGYEGRSAAIFFGAFGGLITNSDFSFETRNRQPPRDPVNILLSLGYTILLARVESIVHQTGLDIALGGLHFPENGKPALPLDLVEEFRPLIVDSTVLKCINLKILKKDDFVDAKSAIDYLKNNHGDIIRPVLFQKSAMSKFLTQLDAKFNSKVFYPPFAAKLSYKDVVLQQTRLLIRNLNNEDKYMAFTPNF